MNASTIKPEKLRSLKCLSRFQEDERPMLLEFVEPVTCGKSVVLFEEGDQGDCMYFILDGQMRVFNRKNGKVVPLKVLEAGDAFGDIALFHHTPRMASVDAVCDSQLLKLTETGLEKFTAKYPALSAKFLHYLAVSLSQMYQHFR